MAGSQAKAKRAEASKAYQLVPVNGPSAGVDLRLSPTELPPERARTLINFSLEQPGALVVRPGYLLFGSQGSTTGHVQGGTRVYYNTAITTPISTIVTIVGYNQNVYTVSDTGLWSASNLANLSTNDYFFPSDRDLCAVLDGSTRGWKSTNGSSWTLFGIDPPSPSTLSSKAGGSLSASEFEINFTYKARHLGTESNGSTSPSTLTLSSTGAIEVQCPNTTDAQVDAIIVYARNKTSGETVRRKASSFAIQSHTANTHSTITITSSGWTTADEEPTDHDVPGVYSYAVVWKNRWWAKDATITNRLHFSQLFQPQSWPALFYVDIPFDRGDAIQAIHPLGDALLVFGGTKIILIIGQTSLDFEVRPTLASQDGALGPRAVCQLENGIVHAGAAGVWFFDGVTDRLLSFDLLPAWQDLIKNASGPDLARTAVNYHQRRKELRVAVARRYPSGTRGEWILDMSRSRGTETAWTATDRDILGYLPWSGPEADQGNRDRLMSWPSSGGFIFEEATGQSANSSNMIAQYEGAGLTLGSFRGRWVDLRIEYEPNVGALTEQAVVDGVSMPSQSVTIGSGLSVYGTAVYGTATYGGSGRRQAYLPRPLSADGRTYVQKFSYTGQGKFRIFNYHLGIVPENKSRAFSE
jgi:hypothetical protein